MLTKESATLAVALMTCHHVEARSLDHRYCHDCGAIQVLPFAAQRWERPRLVQEAIESDRIRADLTKE